MPTRLTRITGAALNRTVQAVRQPPTAPPQTFAASPTPAIPYGALIPILSSGSSGPRRMDAVDVAFGLEDRGIAYLCRGARFSEKSTFTASAGQVVPLGDLTHYRGA